MQELVNEKVRSGEFSDSAEVIEAALRKMFNGRGATRPSKLSKEEWLRGWDAFMADVDREFPAGTPVLSDEALSRDSIYEDERHRI